MNNMNKQFIIVILFRNIIYVINNIAIKTIIKSLKIQYFCAGVICKLMEDIIISMVPCTIQSIIPHAPNTSPIDNDITVRLSFVAVVQLKKFENKSGEELHHESNTAMIIPEDAFVETLMIFDDVDNAECLGIDFCFNSTMFVTLGHK